MGFIRDYKTYNNVIGAIVNKCHQGGRHQTAFVLEDSAQHNGDALWYYDSEWKHATLLTDDAPPAHYLTKAPSTRCSCLFACFKKSKKEVKQTISEYLHDARIAMCATTMERIELLEEIITVLDLGMNPTEAQAVGNRTITNACVHYKGFSNIEKELNETGTKKENILKLLQTHAGVDAKGPPNQRRMERSQ